VCAEKLNHFLEKNQKYMSSTNIIMLFKKLEVERIILDDQRINSIVQTLNNRPEELSGEDVCSLLKFSRGIRKSQAKEIWKVILKKVKISYHHTCF